MLDETFLDSLFLYNCSVEASRSNGQSLPQKITRIREILKDDNIALNLFKTKIFEVGYHDKQEYLYADRCYQIRNESFFLVNGDFPRIKEKELRKGIGDVMYSIVLEMCKEYLVTENYVFNTIKCL